MIALDIQPIRAEQDELWDDAVRVILKSKRGSASLLQRALGIDRRRRVLDPARLRVGLVQPDHAPTVAGRRADLPARL